MIATINAFRPLLEEIIPKSQTKLVNEPTIIGTQCALLVEQQGVMKDDNGLGLYQAPT